MFLESEQMETFHTMHEMKHKILKKLKVDESKLKEYRYIDELHQLTTGAFIRWINLNNPSKLMNGGFVVRVDIEEEGTRVVCKNRGKFFQCWMDECVIFQKLTEQERIVSMASTLLQQK